MGFKKTTIKQEDNFVNAARGENPKPKAVNLKRNNRVMMYFSDEEYAKIVSSANKKGLNLNAYIRSIVLSVENS